MTNTEFQNIFKSMLDYLGKGAQEYGAIQTVNTDYFEAFEKMSAAKFTNLCQVVKQRHKYKTLPLIADIWALYFKYIKTETKEEKHECVKCGGYGRIGIRVRLINRGNHLANHGGFACSCRNGDKFRRSEVPFQNFFDCFGRIVSAQKLLIEQGTVYDQDRKPIVFDAEYKGPCQYIYHGVADSAEVMAQRYARWDAAKKKYSREPKAECST